MTELTDDDGAGLTSVRFACRLDCLRVASSCFALPCRHYYCLCYLPFRLSYLLLFGGQRQAFLNIAFRYIGT